MDLIPYTTFCVIGQAKILYIVLLRIKNYLRGILKGKSNCALVLLKAHYVAVGYNFWLTDTIFEYLAIVFSSKTWDTFRLYAKANHLLNCLSTEVRDRCLKKFKAIFALK